MTGQSVKYALPGRDIPYSHGTIVACSREVESVRGIRKTRYLERSSIPEEKICTLTHPVSMVHQRLMHFFSAFDRPHDYIAVIGTCIISYKVRKVDFYVTRHTTGHLLPVGAGQWHWIRVFRVKRIEGCT
jgi:hypothetical protein